jgi:hypothetical protein
MSELSQSRRLLHRTPARHWKVLFSLDSVAKLGGSRLQSLFVIFDRPLFALSL